jgi:hypothetical protein
MAIRNLLELEIEEEFEKLNKMEVGTEQYKTTVDGLTKLLDRSIEIDKHRDELDEKDKNREIDKDFKSKQVEDEKKDRKIKNGLTLAGIVIPSVITIWGTLKSLKFEKDGTVTTIMGRGFINKLLPKK